MSQLSANSHRTFEIGDCNNLPIKGSTEIFKGSAIGLTAGYARQLVAGDAFGGFAEEHQNNSSVTDGAKTISTRESGKIQLAISGLAVTDINADVYASDGDTFTLTAVGNSFIGKVTRYVSSGVGIVAFNVRNS